MPKLKPKSRGKKKKNKKDKDLGSESNVRQPKEHNKVRTPHVKKVWVPKRIIAPT